MTTFFATGSAGKFFGFGAGGVLSTYTVYTRSEKMRASRRPSEDRRGRRAVAKRERTKNGKLATLAAAAASTARAPADAPASSPEALPSTSESSAPPTPPASVAAPRVDADPVESPPDPAETPVRASATPASSRRDRRATRARDATPARAPRDAPRDRDNPVANVAHLVACVAAPLALRAARDYLRARRRAPAAAPSSDRAVTPEDARELVRQLRADDAHPSAARAAAHIDRLLRERENLLRRLRAARARPSSPSTPLSLRTRAAVARVRELTPENETHANAVAIADPADEASDAAADARSLAELDRVVGFQAKELRYLRMTLAEKERALAAATGNVAAAAPRNRIADVDRDDDGVVLSDKMSDELSDEEHAFECDHSVSVDLSVDERSSAEADAAFAAFAASPVRVFLRVASTNRATSPATFASLSASGSKGGKSRYADSESESAWTPEMKTLRGAASKAADALLRTPASELPGADVGSERTPRGGKGGDRASPGTPEETPATPRVASRRTSPDYDEAVAQRMQRARSRVTRISPTRNVAGRRPL